MPGSQGSGPGLVGCQRCEAPVEDGGHVAGGAEVSSSGGCLQVAQWVLTGFGRQGEQVCSQGRPGRFAGEPGNELVDSVERRHGLRSDEVFGGDVQAVGVALNGIVEPDGGIAGSRSRVVAEVGASSRARICFEQLGRRCAGVTVSGRMTVCGSPSPTTCR